MKGPSQKLFASYGLPEQLVTDNGSQFTSDEFATFLKLNGVKHVRCSPYHPASNGAAERFVQTFKRAMKAGRKSQLSLSQRLASFLLTYRTTPHATTNATPFRPRSENEIRLDETKLGCGKQANQKSGHDQHARIWCFFVGQSVMARNLRPGAPCPSKSLQPVTGLLIIFA